MVLVLAELQTDIFKEARMRETNSTNQDGDIEAMTAPVDDTVYAVTCEETREEGE